MQVSAASRTEFTTVSGHRDGDIAFKRLLTGRPGSDDNFEFSLVRIGEYRTPRHRHNYEQVRFCLEGEYNYGPGRTASAGQIIFHPAGAFYGPQEVTSSALVLTAQYASADGFGFLTYDQLRSGFELLSGEGEFRDGLFVHERDGKQRRVDGYQAVWEKVYDQPMTYPPARYDSPVLIDPEAFDWRPLDGGNRNEHGVGAWVRQLGTFTEGATTIRQVRLDSGGSWRLRPDGRVLLYVLSGTVAVGDTDVDTGDACRFGAEDGELVVRSDEGAMIFALRLPDVAAPAQAI